MKVFLMAEKTDKTDRKSKAASYPKIPKEETFVTNLNNPGLHTRVSGQLRDRGQADPHVEAVYREPSFSNVLGPAPAPLCDFASNDWKQRDPGPSGQQPNNVSHIQQLVTNPSNPQQSNAYSYTPLVFVSSFNT